MSPMSPARRRRWLAGAAVLLTATLSACATSPRTAAGGGTVVAVVAAENFWGSLAAQLGGAHVKVTSVIDNPDADPHDYEATAADGRAIAAAKLAGRPAHRAQAGPGAGHRQTGGVIEMRSAQTRGFSCGVSASTPRGQ